MNSKTNKKQLLIFLIVAYGVTFLMGFIMWYGRSKHLDLTAFVNTQMMYPAAGVMLAYLLTRKNDSDMPKLFFLSFLFITALMLISSILTVIQPEKILEMPGGTVSFWLILMQLIMMGGSILCWIFLLISGKKRRKAYGLDGKHWKASLLCILLFLVLYFLRAGIGFVSAGQFNVFTEILTSLDTWIYIASMPLNFLLVFVAFFGEEYGWRYYLQPMLQKRFGLRAGVLILGIVWGLWHLPVDFLYYVSPEQGFIMLVSQLITCVTYGIFFGFVYMRTNNIWAVVLIHFFNNNLAPVIAGTYTADVLQNQTVSWSQIPWSLVINGLLFGLFLLAKPFRKKERDICSFSISDEQSP